MAHESTGNPMRDRELQRLADSRRFGRDDWSRPDPEDEFAGLMNQRERQWIVNIQLSQLKCENPFLVIYKIFKMGHSRSLFLDFRLFCCYKGRQNFADATIRTTDLW